MAIVTVLTLRSFAAPETSRAVAADPIVAQDCTGTLTVKSGQVSINGSVAQSGATVMTGSTVSTSSNGSAIVDFGPAGRVEIEDGTTATLTCVGGTFQVRTTCARTEVEVKKGSVNVTAPTAGSLNAGQKQKYNGAVELSGTGGAEVEVGCEGGGKAAGGPFISGGLIGLLALIGIGAGIAIGIAVGEGDINPPSSPVR
jgi:phage baseplate assembly protein gpV